MKRRYCTLLICILLLALGIFYAAYVEPYALEVSEVSLESPEIPSSFDGKRIVFVSDIHYGAFFSRERVKDLAEKINQLNPDMVILGGDYASRDSKNTSICLQEFKNIDAPLGKYGVLGNHDYWEGGMEAIRAMDLAGINPLENRGLWVYSNGSRIRIGGVSDLWHEPLDLAPTLEGVNQSDYVILVSHNPDYAERIQTSLVDIVLAGHTHGGQVTFFGIWAPYLTSDYGQKYRGGFARTDYTTVYVTRGVGMTFLPLRFFARPQITVFTLKNSSSD